MKTLTPEMREALWRACSKHPDFARALLGLLDPQPVTPKRRVRRTPTTAKMLRTG